MGFGDPDHQHPLNLFSLQENEATCFRCELPIELGDQCYGCTRCNHFVHQLCFELPWNMNHPLHPLHSLTLFPSSSSQVDCSRCHDPCLSGYTYQCEACLDQFSLHLKCFLTLNLEEKHEHPLTLHELYSDHTCRTCGLLIDDIDSYAFACKYCGFFIHFDCTFLPPTVKRHHAHELTFRYNYPEESDLAYCDVCEDKDGKELDRTLSYYYCKRCDYIAHVHCVTTKPAIVTTQLENFLHEHPMIHSRKPRYRGFDCACNNELSLESCYFCSQCDYKLDKSCAEFPRLIKHPHHKDHALSLGSYASGKAEGELSVCSFCSDTMDDGVLFLQCLDCDYTEHLRCAVCFWHPLYAGYLQLTACDHRKFRCNACGELGGGYRISNSGTFYPKIHYDLHLECYALPGKVDRGCHSHPLDLISSPTKIGSDLSTMFRCDICHNEADPDLWIYCCKQCNYIAHLKCVVGDLLSGLGPSNNFSSIFSIAECKKEQFTVPVPVKPNESICSSLKTKVVPFEREYPIFIPTGFFDVTDSNESFIDVLHCPGCEQPISTQAYSCINDWVLHNVKANMFTGNNQTPIHHEPLALLDEKVVDELYCPICKQLIFPPTYSCPECQIFFHKSCAELPRKYTGDPGHTFVLLPPSMRIDNLSNCACCEHPIEGYAYICRRCKTVLDVVCTLGAPLHKLENLRHSFYSWRALCISEKCKACDNPFSDGCVFFKCVMPHCLFYLHFECVMLPYIVSYKRIHQHPLMLESRLDLSVDDYVCDACEKDLNPCLWAYRCSDSCGDRATSHVSCVVTSNKKCHFKYDVECRYPLIDQLVLDVPLVHRMSLQAAATAIANAPPEEQEWLIFQNLIELVDALVHGFDGKLVRVLLEMDQAEVLHLIESPDALKEKVAEATYFKKKKKIFEAIGLRAETFAKWSPFRKP